MTKLVLAVVIWSVIGLLAALAFRRRGHNFLMFAGLGLWLGPLVIPLMYASIRKQHSIVRVIREGEASSGWLDLLVGIDGTSDSLDSVRQVVAKLAPAIRRIRIVTALDPETANSPNFFDTDEALQSKLEVAALAVGFDDAELAFVSGRADRALVSHAIEEGFDMLLVSARNHRVFGTLFGSAVYRLARRAQIPVLIGPAVGLGKRLANNSASPGSPAITQRLTIGELTT